MATSASNYQNEVVLGNDDGDVEIAVPEVFKMLVRNVVKSFYSKEAYLIVDLIIHRPLIKEDQLIELLHFDRKLLRAAIHELRNISVMRVKLKAETDIEGKTTRQNYYSIAYTTFLAVVKYKLEEMRNRIDKEERASVRRTNFQCPACSKMYSDLEIGHLLDMASNKLLCTYCRSEVFEVTGGDDDRPDARQLMTMYHTQLSPLFEMLRECEQARQDMIDAPVQQDRAALIRDAMLRNNSIVARMPNQGPTSTEVRVSVLPAGHKADSAPKKAPREQPVWMTASVAGHQTTTKNPTQDDVEALFGVKLDTADVEVEGQTNYDELFGVKPEPANWLDESSPNSKNSSHEDASDSVLKALLTHEKVNDTDSNASDDFVDVKNEKEEPMDAETLTADSAMVSVQGEMVPYADVTNEMVKNMAESERQQYIQIGTELYSDLYD